MKVTVTGATGTLGREVVAELQQRGDEVTVLSRDADGARAQARATECRALEWADPKTQAPPAEALRGPGRRGAPARRADRPALERRRQARDPRLARAGHAQPGRGAARSGRRRAARGAGVPVRRGLVRRPGRRARGRVRRRRPTTSWPRCARTGRPRRARPRSWACAWCAPAPAWCCPRTAARWRRCCRPSSSGVGGPVAGGKQYVPWVHTDDVVGSLLHCLDQGSVTAR